MYFKNKLADRAQGDRRQMTRGRGGFRGDRGRGGFEGNRRGGEGAPAQETQAPAPGPTQE